jgi:hypothetical protein
MSMLLSKNPLIVEELDFLMVAYHSQKSMITRQLLQLRYSIRQSLDLMKCFQYMKTDEDEFMHK